MKKKKKKIDTLLNSRSNSTASRIPGGFDQATIDSLKRLREEKYRRLNGLIIPEGTLKEGYLEKAKSGLKICKDFEGIDGENL